MEAAAAVAAAHRREWAFVLAATVRVTRDLDIAEECVQDAYERALRSWERSGVPDNPGAWLTTVARRRALDLRRRDATFTRSLALLVEPPFADEEPHDVPDDRLRLIFTCCHPALDPSAQIALTLRLVCGLRTPEVARGFLVSETAMAARITRAKKKIAAARIPYRVPSAEELPERVDAVLMAVHLVFTTGHTAPAGQQLVRSDLVERAIDLARMLRALLPADREVAALLSLILLTNARSAARTTRGGDLVLLADQDRTLWDREAIDEGLSLLPSAPSGRFALMAAIAAAHSAARTFEDTPWAAIVDLYDGLERAWPSPVVALNRAAAVGFAYGPRAGLAALDALGAEPVLATYGYLAAARADFLSRLGRAGEARAAYEEALMLTENTVERDFLERRLAAL